MENFEQEKIENKNFGDGKTLNQIMKSLSEQMNFENEVSSQIMKVLIQNNLFSAANLNITKSFFREFYIQNIDFDTSLVANQFLNILKQAMDEKIEVVFENLKSALNLK